MNTEEMMAADEAFNKAREHDLRVRRNERFRMLLTNELPILNTSWSGRGDSFVIRYAGVDFVVREVDLDE